MEVVGTFTLLYYLITEGVKRLPDLFRLFSELPFLAQETILLVFCIVVIPAVIDGIEKLIEAKHKLDDKL